MAVENVFGGVEPFIYIARALILSLPYSLEHAVKKSEKEGGGKERTRGIHLLFSLTYTRWPGIFTALGKIGTRRGDMLERERENYVTRL